MYSRFIRLFSRLPCGISAVSVALSSLSLARVAGAQPAVATVEPISYLNLLQVAGGLVVVLLCLGATVFVLRRFSGLRGTSGKLLSIVDALALGPRDRLVVVEVDGRRMLLGISPGRIQPLLELGPGGESPFQDELQSSVRALQQAGS